MTPSSFMGSTTSDYLNGFWGIYNPSDMTFTTSTGTGAITVENMMEKELAQLRKELAQMQAEVQQQTTTARQAILAQQEYNRRQAQAKAMQQAVPNVAMFNGKVVMTGQPDRTDAPDPVQKAIKPKPLQWKYKVDYTK